MDITVWMFIIIAVIIFVIMIVNKKIDSKRFIQEVTPYFSFLKEKDYEFLLKLKYGDDIDSTKMFNKRLKNDVSFIKNLINSNDDGLSENIRTFKK